MVTISAAARPACRPTTVGAEQLAAARLLLGPGVPDDGEQADQPDHDGHEPGPPGDQLAEAGAEQRAVQRDEDRRCPLVVAYCVPSARRGEELVVRSTT